MAVEAADVAVAEGDVGKQVERDAAAERHRRDRLQRLVHGQLGLLQAHRAAARCRRSSGSAGSCRSRAPAAPARRGGASVSRRSATMRDDVEVGPPERGDGGDPEHRRDHLAGFELEAGARTDRDDRLAEGDDHDQAVPLGEVARVDVELRRCRTAAASPSRSAIAMIQSEVRAPPSSAPADDQQRRAEQQPGRQLQDRAEVVVVVGPARCCGRRGTGASRARRSRRSRTAAPRPRTPPGSPARRAASPPSPRTWRGGSTFSSASIALVSQP